MMMMMNYSYLPSTIFHIKIIYSTIIRYLFTDYDYKVDINDDNDDVY